MTKRNCTPKKGKIIEVDEGQVRAHVDEVVRSSVEETLNTLLNEEADRLCNARRYERTDGRKDTRAGYYKRGCIRRPGK